MAQEWWSGSEVVEPAQAARQGVIIPKEPEKPTETVRIATEAEKKAAGLDPNRAYQISNITGKFEDIGGQPTAKPAAVDPNRIMKINSALDALANIRQLAEKSLSVGETAGRVRETPLIGALLGQNRADLEGALSLVEGNLIQDQLAVLAQINPGGIASLANAESEARRLASSIANLDPNQSQSQFLTGVQRAEEYYKRQLEQLGGKREPVVATGGVREGPTVSVTPEESIQAFGEFTGGKPGYDAQGNIVGYRYAEAGNQVYDERGNPIDVGVFGRVTDETIQEPAPSFITGLIRGGIESVTGSERTTATTEALPDWVEMPELQQLFSIPSFKANLGTLFGGGPQEIAQIVQSNFPGTQVFQDEKGNYILQSPSTGQRYAIKPGFQVSDIPRALGTVLAGGGIQGGVRGAMAVGAREAGLQTGIEALQAGTGGTFNPEDIAMAGVGGGVLQKAGEVLPAAAGRVVGTMRRGAAPAPVMPQGAPELPGGLVAPRATGGRIIPEAPSQLNKPRVPTSQEMNQFSSVQEVNYSDLRRGQNVYDWEANQRGEYAEPLIEGYGDLPVGVRLENGEVIVYDGNHRVALAMGEGKQKIPMRVIDARNFDPENMGRRPVQPRQEMTDEELLAELQAPPTGVRGTAGAMSVSEETIRAQRAAELPVPIELARFQRTRNFAEQQRARELAKNNEVGGPIRDRMSQQQDALRQNFERFIEGTGSQVWENPYEQGGVIADALSTLAKRERTKINALYKRAERAGEMREPVSYKSLSDFISGQTPTTREKLAPVLRTVQEQLDAADPNKTGMIDLNQMEDIRKLINKVSSPGTPDASFGRDMRNIIDDATKDAGGDVYRQARAARAKYARDFDDIDLVQKIYSTKPGSTERYVALEKVVDRITGTSAPLDGVNSLLNLLDRAGPRGARAKKELQGAVMEKIRDQAYRGITRDESGGVVIQPSALNTIIVQLDKSGKLDAIFDKKTAELLRTVNDVTKDIVTAPPGSVNASGTSSAIMNAIDTVATFGTTGIPVPAAKILNEFRKALANRSLRKEVKRLLD